MTPRWTVSSRCNGERWEAISPECQAGTDDRHARCRMAQTQGEALAWVGARAAEDVAGQANPSPTVDQRAAIAEIARMRPVEAP